MGGRHKTVFTAMAQQEAQLRMVVCKWNMPTMPQTAVCLRPSRMLFWAVRTHLNVDPV